MKLFSLFPPLLDLAAGDPADGPEVTALHSGNLGDVIYSLPAAFALGVTHYVLNVCADPAFGNRSLNSDAAFKLAPLLLGQGTLRRVSVVQTQVPWEYAEPAAIGVDYVLDAFRSHWIEPSLHLIHRLALPMGLRVRGDRSWLASEMPRAGDLPDGIERPYLVVGLTNRYRRWGDDYYVNLLADVPPERVMFVGVTADLTHKPNIAGAHLVVDDFAQLARVLKGAALVIGNPSFPYALAEALKVPRLVELPDGINVAPLDASGLALHLHSTESLRTRIFQALGLSIPELRTLRLEVEALRGELRDAEARRSSSSEHGQRLERELAGALRACDGLRADLARVEAERHLAHARLDEAYARLHEVGARLHEAETRMTDLGYLFKAFVRASMRSNRVGRKLYGVLSRVGPLRRVWGRVG